MALQTHTFTCRLSHTEEVEQSGFGGGGGNCTVNDSFHFCYSYMFCSLWPTSHEVIESGERMHIFSILIIRNMKY